MTLWIKKQKKLKRVLKKYWNFDSLKPKQIDIIKAFINGRDVIGLLPTGYGKSLCYLIPPLITKKIIFIISPLISLMEDQKEKLLDMGIPVSALHGNNSKKNQEIFDIIDGDIKIVYMSPEYLINGDGLELAENLVENNQLAYFAVDESHCISVWGHDFRTSYFKLNKFRRKFPQIPILAVTATATKQVIEEIDQSLELKDTLLVQGKFDRPNLYLKCEEVIKIEIDIMDKYIKKYKGNKIIIYTNSRRQTVEVSEKINKKYGSISLAYHAGMSKKMREKIQLKFSSGKIKIIVSTIAFGMGIDQIVRCVLIFGAPSSIEEYYQQIGRAGRDGDPAETILFFQWKGFFTKKSGLKKDAYKYDNKDIIKCKTQNVQKMARYFKTITCRRRFILEYFDEVPKFFCCNKKCDNCDRKLKNYTTKIYKILFSKSRDYNKLFKNKFTKEELLLLENANLISNRNNYYQITNILTNWKKLVEVNKKTLENMPKKYKIRLPIL